jgi:hypothetical protein
MPAVNADREVVLPRTLVNCRLGTVVAGLGAVFPSTGAQHARPQQRQAQPPEHLTLYELRPIDMPLHRSITPPLVQCCLPRGLASRRRSPAIVPRGFVVSPSAAPVGSLPRTPAPWPMAPAAGGGAALTRSRCSPRAASRLVTNRRGVSYRRAEPPPGTAGATRRRFGGPPLDVDRCLPWKGCLLGGVEEPLTRLPGSRVRRLFLE